MARQTNAPQRQDLAALKDAELREQHEAILAARAEEISTAAALSAASVDEVVDLTVKEPEPEPEGPIVLGDEEAKSEVRVNTDIEDMTVGAGTYYTFERGKRYIVPKNVADRLEELGYVWH